MTLEVLIPLRNPTEVFGKTVDSLVVQTDRTFSVLISDNFSTNGAEHIQAAIAKLQGTGVPTRMIRPPVELGRVEHWNWLHYQSGAEWFKPLFAGDWLEPGYVAAVREASLKESACAYVYCAFQCHQGDTVETIVPAWAGSYRPPEEMQDIVIRYAMQFGPPSAAAYRRDAFFRCGGYDPSLPICADSLFFCKLAARHGACGLAQPLVHFMIHSGRFTHTLAGRQHDAFRESVRYFADLGATAWHEHWRFPKIGYLRLWLRQCRDRYFRPR